VQVQINENVYFSYSFAHVDAGAAFGVGVSLGLYNENNNHWTIMTTTDTYLDNHVTGPTRDDINGIISIYGVNLNHYFAKGNTVQGFVN
jgi:hypothetical protein